MARQADQQRLARISEYVAQHPGARPAEIATGLDLPRSSVMRALPALDEAGYLLFEERSGGLWPFRQRVRR